ncbi:hypothetical protein GCM10009424_12760 [Sphingomonas ursincola]
MDEPTMRISLRLLPSLVDAGSLHPASKSAGRQAKASFLINTSTPLWARTSAARPAMKAAAADMAESRDADHAFAWPPSVEAVREGPLPEHDNQVTLL